MSLPVAMTLCWYVVLNSFRSSTHTECIHALGGLAGSDWLHRYPLCVSNHFRARSPAILQLFSRSVSSLFKQLFFPFLLSFSTRLVCIMAEAQQQHHPPASFEPATDFGFLSPGAALLDKTNSSNSLSPPSSSSLGSLNGSTSIADHITYHLAQLDAQEQMHQPLALQQANSSAGELIDHSNQHVAECVVEISPNERYGRLNTVLGKGAFKVVHKAIDHEDGFEVAWNVLQVYIYRN